MPLISLSFLLFWACHCDTASRLNKEMMKGLTLRVPVFDIPPFLFLIKDGKNGSVTHGGILGESLNWMSVRFSMRFENVELEEATDLDFINGDLQVLVDKKVDLMPVPTAMKWELLPKIGYSYTSTFEEYYLMQKYPKEESRLTAIIKPFSPTVWLCSIGMIVVFIIVLTVFTTSNPEWIERGRKLSAWGHLNHHTEYVAAIIAYQGYYVLYTAGRPFFILCGCWALMMLVLTYAYTGNLTSCLVTPTFYPIATTLEDIVTMNKKVTTASKTLLIQSLLNATSGPNKVIGDYLRDHPDTMASSYAGVITNVLLHDCVFIGTENVVRVLIGSDLEQNRRCTYTFSPSIPFYSEQFACAMAKGNPFLPFLRNSQMTFMETGLGKRWLAMYIRPIDACRVIKNPSPRSNVPLNLIDLSSAFLFLAFGVGLSTLMFLIERVVSMIHKSKAEKSFEP